LKSLRTPVQGYFLDLLLAARRKAQLTQQQLADELGKPQSFVAKYEGGERRLDVIEFLRLSEALQTDPARIMRQLVKFNATHATAGRIERGAGKRGAKGGQKK
jgi:transcriptional regulator with XRE-family HTH domain